MSLFSPVILFPDTAMSRVECIWGHVGSLLSATHESHREVELCKVCEISTGLWITLSLVESSCPGGIISTMVVTLSRIFVQYRENKKKQGLYSGTLSRAPRNISKSEEKEDT